MTYANDMHMKSNYDSDSWLYNYMNEWFLNDMIRYQRKIQTRHITLNQIIRIRIIIIHNSDTVNIKIWYTLGMILYDMILIDTLSEYWLLN